MGIKRILLVLLVATLAVTGVMAVWAWIVGPGETLPTAAVLPSPTVPTAEEALGPAKKAALEWRSDARLVSVSAAWSGARREALLAGPSGWTFLFYSPSAGEIQYVGVGPEGASLGRRFPAPTPPETVEEEDWRLQAADALLLFLVSGGEQYLRDHPAASVSLRLGVEAGRAVWTILAVEETKEPLILRLDARTGERLP
ncbi:MAG: hypothetical protein N3B68_06540 [Anaerolineae bacterium]|nr:hypothetical protein [Anaerolineae bacterium]